MSSEISVSISEGLQLHLRFFSANLLFLKKEVLLFSKRFNLIVRYVAYFKITEIALFPFEPD